MGIGCSTGYQLGKNEYIDLYNRNSEFRPEAYVRQFHPDSAYVYLSFRTDELQYSKTGQEADFMARMEVDLIVKSRSQVQEQDTVRYLFKDEQAKLKTEQITGRVVIPVRDTLEYELQVDFKDLQKESIRTEIIFLQNQPEDLRYMDVKIEGEPKRFCSCEQGQIVELRPYWGISDAVWNIVDIERDPAPLPFSMTNNISPPEKQVSKSNPKLSSQGWYELPCPQGNTINLEFPNTRRWMIPVFPSDYPAVNRASSLTAPLRYITTNDEYDELRFSTDKRKDVSSFWLSCAPDALRAKKLLGTYYKRVEESNLYFTDSSGEGWKSDRGLVYIAYGSPNRIIREGGKEIWYYSVDNADFGLQMHFLQGKKVKLDRSLDYRQSWYLTVDAWRNGKISNF